MVGRNTDLTWCPSRPPHISSAFIALSLQRATAVAARVSLLPSSCCMRRQSDSWQNLTCWATVSWIVRINKVSRSFSISRQLSQKSEWQLMFRERISQKKKNWPSVHIIYRKTKSKQQWRWRACKVKNRRLWGLNANLIMVLVRK